MILPQGCLLQLWLQKINSNQNCYSFTPLSFLLVQKVHHFQEALWRAFVCTLEPEEPGEPSHCLSDFRENLVSKSSWINPLLKPVGWSSSAGLSGSDQSRPQRGLMLLGGGGQTRAQRPHVALWTILSGWENLHNNSPKSQMMRWLEKDSNPPPFT